MRINDIKHFLFLFISLSFLWVGCSPSETRLLTEIQQFSKVNRVLYAYNKKPFTGIIQDKKGTYLHRELKVNKGYLDGTSFTYFFDGSVAESKTYKNGILNGPSKKYSSSKSLREDLYFLNGFREGKQVIYYPTGEISKELNYKQGQLFGHNKLYYLQGGLKHTFFMNEKGQRDSLWIKYHPNEKLRERSKYKNGILVEPTERFDLEGNLID